MVLPEVSTEVLAGSAHRSAAIPLRPLLSALPALLPVSTSVCSRCKIFSPMKIAPLWQQSCTSSCFLLPVGAAAVCGPPLGTVTLLQKWDCRLGQLFCLFRSCAWRPTGSQDGSLDTNFVREPPSCDQVQEYQGKQAVSELHLLQSCATIRRNK